MGLDQTLYGSSRIGQEQIGEIIASSDLNLVNINTATQNIIGDRYFEMSNHLGNVLEVVSDRKLPVNDGNGNIDYFLADVVSYSDYYPYGMQMPGRNGSTGDYRYGFQGQEMDDEVKGEGSSINYKYRMHDPRIGRLFAVDPLAPEYPHNSPYAFSENMVIHCVELEGLEASIAVIGVDADGIRVYDEDAKYFDAKNRSSYQLDFEGQKSSGHLKHGNGKAVLYNTIMNEVLSKWESKVFQTIRVNESKYSSNPNGLAIWGGKHKGFINSYRETRPQAQQMLRYWDLLNNGFSGDIESSKLYFKTIK